MIQSRALVAVGIVAVVGLGSTPVGSQPEEEPDPCGHVYGQIALSNCWAREAQRADEEMNRAYLAVLNKLSERGAKSLKKAQKLWVEFRKAHLGTLYGGENPAAFYGRDYPVCLSISTVALTRARTRALVRLLAPEDETVCPL